MNVLTVNTLVGLSSTQYYLIEHYDHTGNVIQCSDGLCFAKLRIFSIFMTAVFVRQQIFSRKLRYKYIIYEGKKLKTHFQIVTIYIQHHIKPQIIYTVNIFT